MNAMRTLYSQFEHPRGPLGAAAGWVMAQRASNQSRNRWTVSLLEVQPHHLVLEIGFGPGIAIEAAAARNRAAIEAGRVELRLATLDHLASCADRFDRIFAVNVVQFWRPPQQAIDRLRSLLAADGRLALTYQPRHRGAVAADAGKMGTRIEEWMRTAGLSAVREHVLPLRPIPAVCIVGGRPRL